MVSSLASRATQAAWSSNTIQEPGRPSTVVGTEPSSNQGTN